jgi:hypothetical protein
MRHDWIFDVLSDLKAYAIKNDLLALAAKVEEAETLAKVEIEAQEVDREGEAILGGTPSGRRH